jgi:basic amino acid/polyamine antiporter, APA family
MLIAMFDYLGYYNVCYIGDEVINPARTIPRSIIYCVLACAAGYLAIEFVIIGAVPWREAMHSNFIASDLIQRLYGRRVAVVFTSMILWTAFASVFALLLSYSRVLYAAAHDGYFFRAFARVHPTKRFPHVSLLVLGAVSIAAAFLDLDVVIIALMTTRILVQFIAQIFALPMLHRRLPVSQRPFRMWFYPVPAVIALIGWVYVFITSGKKYIAAGLLTLLAGVVVFIVRASLTRTWPFNAGAQLAEELK